tara:strand:+ start:1843 stop:2061 length:219 start_codon:yes stop_codon:yes gene_type:complete
MNFEMRPENRELPDRVAVMICNESVQMEEAYHAQIGKTPLGAEVFNCSAPDTGNMEVYERYGTQTMENQWLL